jgi:ABC-type multidrug transport system ATPase subunit
VLVVEQHLNLVKRATDRFIILAKGEVVGSGPTSHRCAREPGADGVVIKKNSNQAWRGKYEESIFQLGLRHAAFGGLSPSQCTRQRISVASAADDTVKIGVLLIDSGPWPA